MTASGAFAQVRGRMQTLKEQLFEKVHASLQSATAAEEPAAASTAAARVASDALAGRWRSVLDRCSALTSHHCRCCTDRAAR